MSKQSDAKLEQGYVAKAVPQTCMNCAHFALESQMRTSKYMPHKVYLDESNLRCELGGFAVKKMASCAKFSAKSAPATTGKEES